MAKTIPPPANLEIAALKAKTAKVYDLMTPGPGTPWEDRGTLGVIKAFFKTCAMSLTRPAALLDSIRRPETTGDARAFAMGCGVLWAISILIHCAILLPYYQHQPRTEVDTTYYWLGSALQAVAGIVATFLFVQIGSSVYHKLISTEMQARGAAPLMYNLFAYALGPSILALIPGIGPPLALLWILVLMMILGMKRLHVSAAGAIVASFVTFVAMAAVGVGAFFLVWLVWSQVTGGSITVFPEVTGPKKNVTPY